MEDSNDDRVRGYRKPKDNPKFFGERHMELVAEQREEPETVREAMAKLGESEMREVLCKCVLLNIHTL